MSSAPADLHPILAAVDALDDDFDVFSSRRQPPDEAALAELEEELDRALPPEHRRLLAGCGCAAILVNESVWPRPVAYEIRPAWQMVTGIEIFGVAPPGHPLSLAGQRDAFSERAGDDELVPLARLVGAARYLCVDAAGSVSWWDHGDLEPTDGFDAAVLAFLAQLVEDKDRIKREGVKRS